MVAVHKMDQSNSAALGGSWFTAPLRRNPLKPPALPGDIYFIWLDINCQHIGIKYY